MRAPTSSLGSRRYKMGDGLGFLGLLLSSITLLIIVFYFYTYLQQPEPGFILDNDTGQVVYVGEHCRDEARCLQKGDFILKIGEVDFVPQSRTTPLYQDFRSGGAVPLKILRDGAVQTIPVTARSSSRNTLSRVGALFFPALFWLMGTIALVSLRPRDDRWLILVLYQYDIALWVSAGFLGYSQEAYSAILFRVFIWLFLPLSIHLHLILPDAPFRKHHRWILGPLYLAALVLLFWDQMFYLPRQIFMWTTLAAMAGSLVLLAVRALLPAPAATRTAHRLMLYGVGIGLGPTIVMIAFSLISISALLEWQYFVVIAGVFLIMSPIWPLTYIYAVYRHDLGTFEYRTNRFLGTYGFFSLYITAYVILYNHLLSIWTSWGWDPAFFGLLLSLAFVAGAPLLYRPFQRQVDRRIFGIKYRPNEVLNVFAERIPAAFNMDVLKEVIVTEILPTLLVRQSALYVFGSDGMETVYEQGVESEMEPESRDEVEAMVPRAGRYISFSKERDSWKQWIRLVVPLSIQDRTIGVWLLGRRDPDDYYPRSDIALLGNLANQIAPVIENVRLVEKAQAEVAENRKLQRQLIHSQKMEAIGRLSAGVAHDFNNILSVILGYSNLLLSQFGHDTSIRQALSNMKDAGERAATLTKQLLTFSRQQAMEASRVNLNVIVSDVEKMLASLTGEDIELVAELSEDLPDVMIDPGQMSQVIVNLAVNARDAMPQGGRITIQTMAIECGTGRFACHDGVEPGAYVLLRIRDTGTGIAPDLQSRIFEPYFTTKELGKGTGLGLSTVYGIISQSQGHIFVDSEVGDGAVFSIYLPAVAGEAEPAEELEAGAALAPARSSEIILLAEDESAVRAVIREILQTAGYEVLEAKNGPDALAVSAAFEGQVDLLLTDVVMPQMKGPELAARLSELRPGLKIVYMSGYSEEAVVGPGISGLDSEPVLLQKPFSPETLTRKVREVLEKKFVN